MHNIAVKSGAPLYSGKGLETRKQWFSIIIPSISAVCFRKSFPTILIATCDLRLKQGKLRTRVLFVCQTVAKPLLTRCHISSFIFNYDCIGLGNVFYGP